ncbi:MAG: hypothetical protein RH859_02900 [Longimicrobiales bacterium]
MRRAVALAAAGCLVAGCAVVGTGGPGRPGAADAPAGDGAPGPGHFASADSTLRNAASPCASSPGGRRALLLLALLHQDPRNPLADPDTAALMAARYLHLPGTPDHERRLAEGLYVVALDQGADPGLRPDPAAPGPGLGAGGCLGDGPDAPVSLPVLSTRPRALQVRDLTLRVDSLGAVNGALRGRVDALEAELDRIRRLLQATDTVGAGAGPLPS